MQYYTIDLRVHKWPIIWGRSEIGKWRDSSHELCTWYTIAMRTTIQAAKIIICIRHTTRNNKQLHISIKYGVIYTWYSSTRGRVQQSIRIEYKPTFSDEATHQGIIHLINDKCIVYRVAYTCNHCLPSYKRRGKATLLFTHSTSIPGSAVLLQTSNRRGRSTINKRLQNASNENKAISWLLSLGRYPGEPL